MPRRTKRQKQLLKASLARVAKAKAKKISSIDGVSSTAHTSVPPAGQPCPPMVTANDRSLDVDHTYDSSIQPPTNGGEDSAYNSSAFRPPPTRVKVFVVPPADYATLKSKIIDLENRLKTSNDENHAKNLKIMDLSEQLRNQLDYSERLKTAVSDYRQLKLELSTLKNTNNDLMKEREKFSSKKTDQLEVMEMSKDGSIVKVRAVGKGSRAKQYVYVPDVIKSGSEICKKSVKTRCKLLLRYAELLTGKFEDPGSIAELLEKFFDENPEISHILSQDYFDQD